MAGSVYYSVWQILISGRAFEQEGSAGGRRAGEGEILSCVHRNNK